MVYRPLPLTYPLSQCDATQKTIEHCCVLAGVGDAVPLAWMLLPVAPAQV
ncbi:hypothetical protein [Nocardia cerradoensis]|nr:hypothetical protein [Nocardia cerradoensis]